MLHTPVLFIIFNRPDTTFKVFERIREAKPAKLYIAADGPRSNRPDDKEKCEKVRGVADMVDWDCEVVKLYREENLGCKRAVSGAVTWFFEHEEYGMILEDDCLPNPSFFAFCQENLVKYKDDNRVFHINGSNYLMGWVRDKDYSYYFSRNNSIWGWASWARAWKYYDVNIPQWKEVKSKKYFHDFSQNMMEAVTRSDAFDSVYEQRMDTWDYQWSFTIAINSGLCIIPNCNLISNIGFNTEATHTVKIVKRANLPTVNMLMPVKHPPFMIADRKSERRLFELHGKRGYTWRLKKWKQLLFDW